jgi:hypothetical protein
MAIGMHAFVGDGDLMQVWHILFRKGKLSFASPKCNALLKLVLGNTPKHGSRIRKISPYIGGINGFDF